MGPSITPSLGSLSHTHICTRHSPVRTRGHSPICTRDTLLYAQETLSCTHKRHFPVCTRNTLLYAQETLHKRHSPVCTIKRHFPVRQSCVYKRHSVCSQFCYPPHSFHTFSILAYNPHYTCPYFTHFHHTSFKFSTPPPPKLAYKPPLHLHSIFHRYNPSLYPHVKK